MISIKRSIILISIIMTVSLIMSICIDLNAKGSLTKKSQTHSSNGQSVISIRDSIKQVEYGRTVPWGVLDKESIISGTAAVDRAPSYLMWYTGFGERANTQKLQDVVDLGATPIVTWESWDWTKGVNQPAYSLSTITGGNHDAYITQFAKDISQWGGPVMLRWGHEANGHWYPWSGQVNGNTPDDYVAAWKHIHDIFEQQGANNVSWVWSPNAIYPGSVSLDELYPGDSYVDIIGIDGYNWGTSHPGHTWVTPSQIFDTTIAELKIIAPTKPLLIAETASTEVGGNKSVWISQLFVWAQNQPNLEGIIWFDENKETDWRINSSDSSLEAFKQALQKSS